MKTAGFIGVGSMGAPMARRVMDAGFALTVCDSHAPSLVPFAESGATVTARASDCAAADVIAILVANDSQLLAVTLGDDGIVAGLKGNHRPLVVIMSTVLPDTVQKVQQGMAQVGIHVIDAPVSGGLAGAQHGTLAIMVGGEQAHYQRALPLLQSMGTAIFHCGGLGAGQVAKIINNMFGITTLFLAPEAYQLARHYGVNSDDLAPILEAGTGRNFTTQDMEVTREQYARWGSSQEAFDSLAGIIRKDLHLAQELARTAGLAMPMLDGIAGTLDKTIPSGVLQRWRQLARED